MKRDFFFYKQSRQKGAVLIAFILVLLVSSGYYLISRFDANTNFYVRQKNQTAEALKKAKQALIGYAVNYPEIDGKSGKDAINGPGRLPCPDLDNDGDSEGACALAGPINYSIGRFPFKTVETYDLRDGSGERLWYALSDNFRTRTAILNSETTTNFTIDGMPDIVAVIIAPGVPVTGQEDRNKFQNDLTQYLEDENSDLDNHFVTNLGVQFQSGSNGEYDANGDLRLNDIVTTITKQDLMDAVEKRVLAEVDIILTNYRTNPECIAADTCGNAYPWLSPFLDPSLSAYRGVVGTVQGHLPFHWASDPGSQEKGGTVMGRNPFSTDITMSWRNIIQAEKKIIKYFFEFDTMSSDCLNDIRNCDEGGLFPEITSLSSASKVDCIWSNKETADCGPLTATVRIAYQANAVCAVGVLTRTYTIDFPVFTGTSNISPPSSVTKRTRDVTLVAVFPNYIPAQDNVAIRIEDTFTGELRVQNAPNDVLCQFYNDVPIAMGTSTFTGNEEGTLIVSNIEYDLDVDGGELPVWFIADGWHNLVYIAYASGELLPGGLDTCTQNVNCIALKNDSGKTLADNVRAVAISAGADLSDENLRRPSANLKDYLEKENSFPVDNVFFKERTSHIYNDKTRIISVAP